MKLAFAAGCLSAMAAFAACNDDGVSNPDSDMGARSACSTGPAHTDAGDFATGTAIPGDHPQCLNRCGTTPADGPAVVPSGACTVNGEVCNTGAQYFCGPDKELGRVDAMQCQCTAGQWACIITAQGGGICASQADAG